MMMYGEDGKTIASPFLRTDQVQGGHQSLQVEFEIAFISPAMLGAILKSAHLAMYRLLGYSYALAQGADYVRRRLARFFENKAEKAEAAAYFEEFTGAVRLLLGDIPAGSGSTLEDDTFLLHFYRDGRGEKQVFARSCLFRLNGVIFTVRMPECHDNGAFESALGFYQASLKDPAMPQETHNARLFGSAIHCHPEPIRVRFELQATNR